MQNVNTMIRRPVPVGTAAAGSILAFVAGAVIALSAPAVVNGASGAHSSTTSVSEPGVGAEQISHDRSEQGLGRGASAGEEQIAHNRSESGLTDK